MLQLLAYLQILLELVITNTMNEIRIFSPATIANISCGFDVLGLSLDTIGDEMLIRKVNEKGIKITKIIGQDLPKDPFKNVAGVAAMIMIAELNLDFGFEIEIYKHIKPGSGIGSSAASASGVVFAINQFLNKPFSTLKLIEFAMEGERLASGVPHADNVAPALFGGITLVRSYNPLDVIKLNNPTKLYATVLHPHIELKTSDSRDILKSNVSLKDAIKQWGNVGGLVAGLYKEDYDLIGRSLNDYIIEPVRSILIPSFNDVKDEAIKNGALGCGISGSGPSIFALSKGQTNAKKVAKAMNKVYKEINIKYDIHISKVNNEGIKILNKE